MDALWQPLGRSGLSASGAITTRVWAEAEASPDLFITLSGGEPNSCGQVDGCWFQGPLWAITWGILKHLFATVSSLRREELAL